MSEMTDGYRMIENELRERELHEIGARSTASGWHTHLEDRDGRLVPVTRYESKECDD